MLFTTKSRLCINDYNDSVRQQVVQSLASSGVVVAQVTLPDSEGRIFKQLIEGIGEVQSQDCRGAQVWHIKYDPGVCQKSGTRSMTTKHFEMHTDGSFELTPPKFVAMYVVQEDACGGGASQLIDGRRLLQNLSPSSRETLQTSRFTCRVPQEFLKDKLFVDVTVLDAESNFRFRRELIVRDNCSLSQIRALRELEYWLEQDKLVESAHLKTGTIFIIDNGKFFHARTEVKDRNRHLLRMRFQPKIDLPCKITVAVQKGA